MPVNLQAAWIGFLIGSLAGAVPGVFFHKADWLGGYDSWPRRMIRLGHISFFGLGFLNLGFALSVHSLALTAGVRAPSALLIVGAIAMPTVCYLSAWRSTFRHLFFVPVVSITLGAAFFSWELLRR
jgi:hypothetical protein